MQLHAHLLKAGVQAAQHVAEEQQVLLVRGGAAEGLRKFAAGAGSSQSFCRRKHCALHPFCSSCRYYYERRTPANH